MLLETTLKITPAGIFVEEIDENGGKTFKQIALEDLQGVFERTTIDTPLLPLNTIYYNRSEGGKWSIACLVPPQVKTIPVANRYQTDGDFVVQAPIPYTIFGFQIDNGVVVGSYCTCTKYNPIPDGDLHICPTSLEAEAERARLRSDKMATPTFLFPYGNTWDDFRICWGNMRLPNINEPSEITQLITMFFNGACNGDLFHINRSVNFVDYMHEVDGKAAVDFNDLTPHRNRCLRDFINCLIR